MIPTRTSRPFGRISPRVSDTDLARLIDRTIEMRVKAKREQGYAAVNTGCDGRKRTTMFDGSVCQVEGEVCIATRQDGISACIEAPTQGNGLLSQSIVFASPVCIPATGLFLLDAAGYLYRVPDALTGTPAYWPPEDVAAPEALVVLVRAGSYAQLLCGAEPDLFPVEGGPEWVNVGEFPGAWTQRFAAAIGGDEDGWIEHDFVEQLPGILNRSSLAPSIGVRSGTVTLADAPSGVEAEATVAYGYPFGRVLGLEGADIGTLAPYPRTGVQGTYEADCAGRILGDMSLCYSRRLGVAYTRTHVCLDGAAITDPGDYVSTDEIDERSGPARDVATDILAMPGGEIILLGPTDLRVGERYRIRPAPDTAPTVGVTQQAKGVWGDDPNPWTYETTYTVDAWLAGADEFTVTVDLTAVEAPGRGVPVVLWETSDSGDTYLEAPVAYYGTLGETSGGLTEIAFVGGTTILASSLTHRRLTVIGPKPRARYGWTFEVDDVESALSPLADYTGEPDGPLYSVEVTMPGGPTGTTTRRLYRFGFDDGGTAALGVAPWDYISGDGGNNGAVYDRMCKLVATHEASVLEPGTDPITLYDEETDLTLTGTRPPSPLIYVGAVAIGAPVPLHVAPPLSI